MATKNKTGNTPVEAAALTHASQEIGLFMAGDDLPCDRLTARAAQLSALLGQLSGEGFEAFKQVRHEDQQNLLWLARDLADEIDVLAGIAAPYPKGDAS